jgi:hypothetical protein
MISRCSCLYFFRPIKPEDPRLVAAENEWLLNQSIDLPADPSGTLSNGELYTLDFVLQ